jgi:HAD superfamily hydrolase (TIGR01549 family)
MRILIFDFDGTIADSFEVLLGIFEEIHARPQKLSPQEVQQLRGQSIRQIIKYLNIRRFMVPRLILKAKRLLKHQMKDIRAFQYLPKIIRQLHAQGVPMYILSTNSQANIELFLKNNKMDSCFTKIYGDIGLRAKSSALKKIIRKEKLKKNDCVYIGDEVRDIEAARKAKVTSVGVTWGFNNAQAIKAANPDILAQNPKDLLKI